MRRFGRTAAAPFINPNDGGLLFLQWLVTIYARSEENDLRWHRNNQAKLRKDKKEGIHAHVNCIHIYIWEGFIDIVKAVAEGVEDANDLGYPSVMLSKSYMGGGRYYTDAFLVCAPVQNPSDTMRDCRR